MSKIFKQFQAENAQIRADNEKQQNDPEFQRIRREALAEDRAVEESYSKRDFRVG